MNTVNPLPMAMGRLPDVIRAHGVTTEALSTATGIAYTTLHRRMRGASGFTVNEVVLIAAALGTTAPALLAEAEAADAAA